MLVVFVELSLSPSLIELFGVVVIDTSPLEIVAPLDVVSVGDIVKVWVVSVNLLKGRVELTMLAPNEK